MQGSVWRGRRRGEYLRGDVARIGGGVGGGDELQVWRQLGVVHSSSGGVLGGCVERGE